MLTRLLRFASFTVLIRKRELLYCTGVSLRSGILLQQLASTTRPQSVPADSWLRAGVRTWLHRLGRTAFQASHSQAPVRNIRRRLLNDGAAPYSTSINRRGANRLGCFAETVRRSLPLYWISLSITPPKDNLTFYERSTHAFYSPIIHVDTFLRYSG